MALPHMLDILDQRRQLQSHSLAISIGGRDGTHSWAHSRQWSIQRAQREPVQVAATWMTVL
jgi:hypothetical protein